MTGIPSAQKIKKIRGAYDRGQINKSNRDQYLMSEGLGNLCPHIEADVIPLTIQEWLQSFVKYYNTVFAQLQIDSSLRNGRYHTTTHMEPEYDNFVNQIYDQLEKRGKIVFGKNPTITCSKCQIVLGDHERASGEGLGVEVNSRWASVGDYILEQGENEGERVTEPTPISKSCRMVSGKIKCRCGGLAKITLQQTYFIRFDESWKTEALDLLKATHVSSKPIRTILEGAIRELRDYSFLRDNAHALGTKLRSLEGTKEENHLVDPLGDSMIHTWFAKTLYGESSSLKCLQKSPIVPAVYYSSIDLLKNHIPLMVMIHSLLGTPLPAMAINGYLLGPDSQKMSKSRGNTLEWQGLRAMGITGTDLRFFFANLTDTIQSSTVDPQSILNFGRAGKRHISKLLKSLERLHLSAKSWEILGEIRRLVRPWECSEISSSIMGLRRCTHLLFHELKESLVQGDEGLDSGRGTVVRLLEAYAPKGIDLGNYPGLNIIPTH